MAGLGTLINAAGVIAGGIAGLLFGNRLKARFQDILICVCGLSVIFIGAAGVLEEMLTVSGGVLSTRGALMLIFSLGAGALTGELIDLERRTERFGEWLKIRSHSERDPRFVEGFAMTSLTICIGAMAVIGPIRDAIYGDISILLTKTILDAIIVLALTASHGKGCIFSFIPLACIQGLFTALAKLIEPLMTPLALSNLSLVGSVLIFAVGINLVFGKKIKVANLLPSLIFAVACAFIPIAGLN